MLLVCIPYQSMDRHGQPNQEITLEQSWTQFEKENRLSISIHIKANWNVFIGWLPRWIYVFSFFLGGTPLPYR